MAWLRRKASTTTRRLDAPVLNNALVSLKEGVSCTVTGCLQQERPGPAMRSHQGPCGACAWLAKFAFDSFEVFGQDQVVDFDAVVKKMAS